MIEGTTPTFILTITDDNVDLTQASKIVVSFKQDAGNVDLRKSGDDIVVTEKQVSVYLTQEETLPFVTGKPIRIQINWVYANRSRSATVIKTISVSENLIQEVIEP
jgi:hypothetical protein